MSGETERSNELRSQVGDAAVNALTSSDGRKRPRITERLKTWLARGRQPGRHYLREYEALDVSNFPSLQEVLTRSIGKADGKVPADLKTMSEADQDGEVDISDTYFTVPLEQIDAERDDLFAYLKTGEWYQHHFKRCCQLYLDKKLRPESLSRICKLYMELHRFLARAAKLNASHQKLEKQFETGKQKAEAKGVEFYFPAAKAKLLQETARECEEKTQLGQMTFDYIAATCQLDALKLSGSPDIQRMAVGMKRDALAWYIAGVLTQDEYQFLVNTIETIHSEKDDIIPDSIRESTESALGQFSLSLDAILASKPAINTHGIPRHLLGLLSNDVLQVIYKNTRLADGTSPDAGKITARKNDTLLEILIARGIVSPESTKPAAKRKK